MRLIFVMTIFGGKLTSAEELGLTQEKKEELYEQYVKIVEEENLQYPNSEISIDSLATFKDEYFMAPEDYKEFVIDLATFSVLVEP
ncbi:hypothetical protein HNO89_003594 [Sporosarcina luteola]|nr:hypothetical protein [Sporosarcina luteola]